MNGEIYIVEDVPASYAAFVSSLALFDGANAIRLICSGGASGKACAEALLRSNLDLSKVELYFADERCVPDDSPELNANTIKDALGSRFSELASFHPMSCANGAEAYERELRAAGRLDVAQLGMGDDGHTASLFPHSPALGNTSDALVTMNEDLSGKNPHRRLTMTLRGLSLVDTVLITVVGREKRPVLEAIARGAALPAAKVTARRVIWLIDRDVAEGIDELAMEKTTEPVPLSQP